MHPISSGSTTGKCSTCALGQFCLPVGLSPQDLGRIDALARDKIRLKKGDALYRMGEPLSRIFAVRLGTLKTSTPLNDGREQVTGFHMPGEILGLDGIADLVYPANAVALEDGEVCVIHYPELENLARQLPSLQSQFHRLLSREISADRLHFVSLGSLRAEERLANFLLNLSERLSLRGYAASEFHLRMSREDLGSYLGLQVETVSRLFSRFMDAGLLQVKQRHVLIIDMAGLRELAGRAPLESMPCPHHHNTQ